MCRVSAFLKEAGYELYLERKAQWRSPALLYRIVSGKYYLLFAIKICQAGIQKTY